MGGRTIVYLTSPEGQREARMFATSTVAGLYTEAMRSRGWSLDAMEILKPEYRLLRGYEALNEALDAAVDATRNELSGGGSHSLWLQAHDGVEVCLGRGMPWKKALWFAEGLVLQLPESTPLRTVRIRDDLDDSITAGWTLAHFQEPQG